MITPTAIRFAPVSLFALAVASATVSVSCATLSEMTAQEPTHPPTPGAFHLLDEVEPIPSEVLAERSPREDMHIQTMTGFPTPSEIASGQTPELVVAPGMRVSLAGDAEGTEEWSVNNLVLFEVLVEGLVIDRFGIGFFEPIHIGSEMVEAVGGYSPRFDPRSPIITQRLPTHTPFVLRATALDYRTVGAVSSLFLLIEETDGEPSYRELRDD